MVRVCFGWNAACLSASVRPVLQGRCMRSGKYTCAKHAHTNDSITVLSSGFETLAELSLKFMICNTIKSSQHLNIFWRQFKWRSFKTHISWGITQNKPKINVNQMTVAVQEDVSVVTILDLEKKCDNGITFSLYSVLVTSVASETAPARDFAKFRWALANFAEDGSPYVFGPPLKICWVGST